MPKARHIDEQIAEGTLWAERRKERIGFAGDRGLQLRRNWSSPIQQTQDSTPDSVNIVEPAYRGVEVRLILFITRA